MMAENETNHMTIASLNARIMDLELETSTSGPSLDAMIAENETNHMTIASLNARITDLEAELVTSTNGPSEDSGEDLVVAVIVIVSALLVISSVTLAIVVFKEKRGAPVFAPVAGTPARNVPVGSPVYGNPTKGAEGLPDADNQS
jgi:hypothetical protein